MNMKKFIIFIVAVFCNIALFSQNSGKGFNYQAVARDLNGAVRQNELIEIRFSLLEGSANGVGHWIEEHTTATDAYGTFSLIVGKGTKDPNSAYNFFNQLSFNRFDYWLKIEIKDNGVWNELSNQQLLSVPYAENAPFMPVGSIISFAGDTITAELIEQGWMLCDGAELNRTEYATLFATIGTAWGYGNGTSTFNLPDMQGLFLRGKDNNAGRDPDKTSRTAIKNGGNTGNSVGSYQADEFKSHNHRIYQSGNFGTGQNANSEHHMAGTWNTRHQEATGGSETRPRNVYVNYIIKVK